MDIVTAITGASGALYAQRSIQGLVAAGVNVHLVVSPLGRRLLHDELGMEGVDVEALAGMVAAGNIGSERFLQYATIGDATNVAARICSVAGPGQIVIGHGTLARVPPGRFPTEALPRMQVKGKAEALSLHRVLWA